ncbi:hypothetical protein [Romboutsia lituseburensis]|uniref:hypothetical protein n=1 Tax=Romboutsia lituseburensis TaxID=1537 RepID=UPI00215AB30C|nr:hypothetical protein [Romboutsia lituseburensis]MCR8743894.1 hypothetical protein [Romboutsia lituseburensis]
MNVGSMFKNIYSNNNNLGFKMDESKRYLKPNEEIKEIEKKLSGGMSVDDLSKEEYQKLNAFEKAETAEFYSQVNREMSKAEKLAMKIAKGEKLTEEEIRFISEKYPDLKRDAEQTKKESDELKKNLKHAKTKKEKQQIISMAVGNVGTLLSKNSISPVQAKIKLSAIEKAVEEDEGNKDLINKELKIKNIKKGSFINKEL